MLDVNELILSKLKKYNSEVYELAVQALSHADNLSEHSIAEYLENVARKIIRNRGAKDDSAKA